MFLDGLCHADSSSNVNLKATGKVRTQEVQDVIILKARVVEVKLDGCILACHFSVSGCTFIIVPLFISCSGSQGDCRGRQKRLFLEHNSCLINIH